MYSHAFQSIFELILNEAQLSELKQLAQMRSVLQTYPDMVHEKYHFILLHYAALFSPPNVCKLLIESDTELKSVKTKDSDGELPFHKACGGNNIETATYLFHLWPTSIDIPDNDSRYPIHYLLESYKEKDVTDLCQFLLGHDQGAGQNPIMKKSCLYIWLVFFTM